MTDGEVKLDPRFLDDQYVNLSFEFRSFAPVIIGNFLFFWRYNNVLCFHLSASLLLLLMSTVGRSKCCHV